MTRFIAVLILCCTAPAQPTTGTIGGIVVDAATKDPVPHAVATLSIAGSNKEAVVWSDDEGRFAFTEVPAGRYLLRANKESYEKATRPAAVITLAAGQQQTGYLCRLQRRAVISGTVFDEDGDPIKDAQVHALVRASFQGEDQYWTRESTRTDASGHYSLAIPNRGAYILAAEYTRPSHVPLQFVHPVQYYPGKDHVTDAVSIPVRPGKNIDGLDFHLVARAPVTLKVRLTLPQDTLLPEGTAPEVAIYPPSSLPGAHIGDLVTAPDYAATYNLPPGEYVVDARAYLPDSEYRTFQNVRLADQSSPVELVIALQPGIEVDGHVSVTGPGAKEHVTQSVELYVPSYNGPHPPPRLSAAVDKEGNFRFAHVPPGTWNIGASPMPEAGYFKSIRLSGRDLPSGVVTIGSSPTGPLSIVIGTKRASVEGTLVDAHDQPVRGKLVLVPSRELCGYPHATADETGHFKFTGVQPCAYRLFAFEELPGYELAGPEAIRPFESLGVDVEPKDGEKLSRNVHIIPANVEGHQ